MEVSAMTTTAELLLEAYGRITDGTRDALDGLGDDLLLWRADDDANTIGWLAWHLLRVQDDHLSNATGNPQVWLAEGWAERFGLPFDNGAIGYGQSTEEVGEVRVGTDLLLGYLEAVDSRTKALLAEMTDSDLDKVVDDRYDPPVTLAVRLVSVLEDDLQHLGQIGFVRGLAERASW
jgi:hypothetical protein